MFQQAAPPRPSGRSILAQFRNFAGIGVIGTGGHFLTLWTLVRSGADPLPASALGFVAGALINYVLNRRYTFASTIAHRRGLPKFFTVAAAGLVLNTLLMVVLLRHAGMHYLLAQALATATVLCWNFAGNRYWTFPERRP